MIFPFLCHFSLVFWENQFFWYFSSPQKTERMSYVIFARSKFQTLDIFREVKSIFRLQTLSVSRHNDCHWLIEAQNRETIFFFPLTNRRFPRDFLSWRNVEECFAINGSLITRTPPLNCTRGTFIVVFDYCGCGERSLDSSWNESLHGHFWRLRVTLPARTDITAALSWERGNFISRPRLSTKVAESSILSTP